MAVRGGDDGGNDGPDADPPDDDPGDTGGDTPAPDPGTTVPDTLPGPADRESSRAEAGQDGGAESTDPPPEPLGQPPLHAEHVLGQTEFARGSIRDSNPHADGGGKVIQPEPDSAAAGEHDSRFTLNTGLLWSQLDTLEQDLLHDVEAKEFVQNLVVGTTAASLTGLTVGYVIWLIRGGTLLATMISSLPAWMAFDPLPILDSFEESEQSRRTRRGGEEKGDEDLAALASR